MKNKSIIKDIFYGKKGNGQTMNLPKTARKYGNILCDTYEELKEKLSPELFALHEKFIAALDGERTEEVDFYFAEGFKLGLLIGIECTEE